jgi:hypothetical protein
MSKVTMNVMIYLLSIRNHIFMFPNRNDFYHDKFELTEKSVRDVTKADEKARHYITSCNYQEQLDNAESYCRLLFERFPFAILINQIHLLMINDLRLGNKTVGIEQLPSMYINENDYK